MDMMIIIMTMFNKISCTIAPPITLTLRLHLNYLNIDCDNFIRIKAPSKYDVRFNNVNKRRPPPWYFQYLVELKSLGNNKPKTERIFGL
jgi:hypothetical protein